MATTKPVPPAGTATHKQGCGCIQCKARRYDGLLKQLDQQDRWLVSIKDAIPELKGQPGVTHEVVLDHVEHLVFANATKKSYLEQIHALLSETHWKRVGIGDDLPGGVSGLLAGYKMALGDAEHFNKLYNDQEAERDALKTELAGYSTELHAMIAEANTQRKAADDAKAAVKILTEKLATMEINLNVVKAANETLRAANRGLAIEGARNARLVPALGFMCLCFILTWLALKLGVVGGAK